MGAVHGAWTVGGMSATKQIEHRYPLNDLYMYSPRHFYLRHTTGVCVQLNTMVCVEIFYLFYGHSFAAVPPSFVFFLCTMTCCCCLLFLFCFSFQLFIFLCARAVCV